MPERPGMAVDIDEIPATIGRLAADRAEIAAVGAAMRRARPRWVSIAARGTSDHVAIYLQYLLARYCGLPAGLALPSVTTVYGARLNWRGGLLIAVSQSGESPDVRQLAEDARRGGALTIAITNRPTSPLAGVVDHVLDCRAGDERAVPATKTYVSSLAVAAALVAEVAAERRLSAALDTMGDVLANVGQVTDRWLVGPGNELVDELATADRALVISRGYNLATAYEIALKLKEACGLFASGFSSADVLHGPLVVAEPGVPLLAFRPDGPIGHSIDAALDAAEVRGIRPWVVGGAEAATRPRSVRMAHGLLESLTPLAYAMMGQLVCERVAERLGRSPDAPIGLSKVTRTL